MEPAHSSPSATAEPAGHRALVFGVRPVLARVGLVGLFLFGIFGFLGKAGANLGLVLMLGAALATGAVFWRTFRREPLGYLFLAFVVLLAALTHLSVGNVPEAAGEQWKAFWQWMGLWLFLLAAWWFDGRTGRILWVLFLALVGFAIKAMVESGYAGWEDVFSSMRREFGFGWLPAGLFSGIGLLGLLGFAPRILARNPEGKFPLWSRALVWVVLVLIMGQIFITTQSRGAWIATIIGLVMIFAARLLPGLRQRRIRWGAASAVILALAVAVAGLGAANWHTLEKRVSSEQRFFKAIADDPSIENIPFTSLGARVHMWYFGFQRWLERPMTGWGPGTAVTRVFENRDFSDPIEARQAQRLVIHPHLHNSYLSVLVRLGVIGALVLFSASLLLLWYTWTAYRDGLMERDVFWFFAASFVAVGLWNLINYHLTFADYRTLMILLGGAAYSYHLAAVKRAGPAAG